ncbi:AI-2E family transporter [Anaerovoracaceae bacterium 41-7]|uniref:AI-2E family transporter n=1 Tax=Anaerotruncus colihominis TaxID=169435 RepID=A0A845QJD6_9FIRM|nr:MULTISPECIES: AI-2E family transporter [Clostridia]MCI9475134.1 AI-2E family transporter [Emergencia sp.]NBH60228.1 AI-2E family transporter [Anaerotruncus colihominis]NCF00882.1 AI-2E family transporter [Anaerotruncus sp. 80]MCI9638551.1 AI-2E family transporter [Emergencia sp.]NCE99722.1 AI-2E family transporter [Emergencia sp. 1XD21-10]
MDWNKKNIKTTILIAFACILFYLGVKNIGLVMESLGSVLDVTFPFILGACIAFVLNVPMTKIENRLFRGESRKKKGSRAVSFLVTLTLVLGIIVVAMYIIIPQLSETMMSIAEQLPVAFNTVQEWISANMGYFRVVQNISEQLAVDWGEIVQKVSVLIQDAATTMINSGISTVSNIIGALVSFFIGFVFAVYILMAKEKLAGQGRQILYAFLKEQTADKVLYVLGLSSKTFSKFISGQCLEACILGLMFFVTMTIFGLPYAMLISVLIAFTALIPMVGAFIGCAIGVLLILMVSPLKALIFLAMFLVLQQIEGNLIYPHVVGGSIGLPSIWVLVAITVGGNLMGVAGMIIFIPICSVLYALFRLYVKNRLAENNVSPEKWQEKAEFAEEVLLIKKDRQV